MYSFGIVLSYGFLTLMICVRLSEQNVDFLTNEESQEISISSNKQVDASSNEVSQREGKFFPFYTIGRFPNLACMGINDLTGTCVLAGECSDAGGIATGNCTTLTFQAVCCVYQSTCGDTTSYNNTYFVNTNFPGAWTGGSGCSLAISPSSTDVCQLRLDFLDLALASPDGNGYCNRDVMTVTGGSSYVPPLCGINSGQHVYVNFDGQQAIIITIAASSSFTFGRKWNIKATQYDCSSPWLAPAGCLQYYWQESGIVSSFNYGSAANSAQNSVGVEGTRQLANLNYGICIAAGDDQCSITYSTLSSDMYSFTITGDVGSVDPSLLGTSTLQEQSCTTDFVIIPNPTQTGANLSSDRFCGLGLATTTSFLRKGNVTPFVLYAITDSNEQMDIANRGFALSYSQNECPVII